jgi:secondary thiamine-phosphate synthase enzyme
VIELTVKTSKQTDFVEITSLVRKAVSDTKIREGVCYIFIPHTTAGITINENADPDVITDMTAGLEKIVPQRGSYQHSEGNSPAHIKSSLMGSSITVFIENGSLALGTWQGIYLAEFDGPRTRKIWIKII